MIRSPALAPAAGSSHGAWCWRRSSSAGISRLDSATPSTTSTRCSKTGLSLRELQIHTAKIISTKLNRNGIRQPQLSSCSSDRVLTRIARIGGSGKGSGVLAEADEGGDEAASAGRGELGQHHGGAGDLGACAEALRQAQRNQQDGGPDADHRVGGEDADEGCEAPMKAMVTEEDLLRPTGRRCGRSRQRRRGGLRSPRRRWPWRQRGPGSGSLPGRRSCRRRWPLPASRAGSPRTPWQFPATRKRRVRPVPRWVWSPVGWWAARALSHLLLLCRR